MKRIAESCIRALGALLHRGLLDRLYPKIVLLSSAITALALLALGLMVSSIMSDTLLSREADYEAQAISGVARHIAQLELQFGSLLYSVNDKRFTDITQYLRAAGEPGYAERARVLNHLSAMLSANEDMLDVILIKTGSGEVLSKSRSMRWVMGEYDFAEQPWFLDIKAKQGELSIIPTHAPAYIRQSGELAFSYAVNLYHNFSPDRRQDIGTLLVNYRADSLGEPLRDFTSLMGNVIVMNRVGMVLYDRLGRYAAQPLPFFDALRAGASDLSVDGVRMVTQFDHTALSNYAIACLTPREQVLRQAYAVRRLFFLSVLLVIPLTLIAAALSGRMMVRKVARIQDAMRAFETGDLSHKIEVSGGDELDQLAIGVNKMSGRLQSHIEQSLVMGIKQKDAELSALQAQINPHFLFNTLEEIRMRSIAGGGDVAEMILALGKILRFNLRNRESIVSVRQEMLYLDCYLQLQKHLHGDRLDYAIRIEPELMDKGIIKFSLQPILENAVVHGMDPSGAPCLIELIGRREGDTALFEVIDDGQGIDPERLGEIERALAARAPLATDRIGLCNVNDRIRILFGEGYGLSVCSGDGRTAVSMRIPLRTI